MRITVAATLVIATALLLAAAAILATLRSSVESDLDQVAELHASDLVSSPSTWAPGQVLPADEDEIVQVVDASGRVVAGSADGLVHAALVAAVPTPDEPTHATVQDPAGRLGSYRVVAVAADPPRQGTVVVATNLKQADDTVSLVRTSLVWGAPALTALVAVLTWIAVGRALRPVERIRAQVATISGHDITGRVPVPPGADEVTRLAVTMNAMLDRLDAAAERQRRFVADASHELRSPLTASTTMFEVALKHPESATWSDDAAAQLELNRRMDLLVSDLLHLAEGDAARPLPTSLLDLHELVIEEALSVGAPDGISVDVVRVGPAFVRGHERTLRQIVRNLVDNATRYATSRVVVRLDSADGVVELVVEDDGPGIPVDDRERVFDRFARLDRSRDRRTGGTGLGLAIVRQGVQVHGGRVRVDDASPGARLVVTLPHG